MKKRQARIHLTAHYLAELLRLPPGTWIRDARPLAGELIELVVEHESLNEADPRDLPRVEVQYQVVTGKFVNA